MKISIIGFGKIGQAIGANILRAGLIVHAVDRDPDVVKAIADGSFTSTEPQVAGLLLTGVQEQRLTVSLDPTSAAGSDAVIVAIPLSVDENNKPDHGPFIGTITALGPVLVNGTLLIIETSVPVGFCRGEILVALERNGKRHGVDFQLVHSPERIKSGTMLEQLARIPKIIGGVTSDACQLAVELYSKFFRPEQMTVVHAIEAAEMVKMAGMMYRDINIALANQLAVYADAAAINLSDLREIINSDGEARLLQPGIGVGGHCTPVYPYLMMDSFSQLGLEFSLAREARTINEGMAAHALSLLPELPVDSVVLVLGLAFRPGVAEDANSPAYLVVKGLEMRKLKPVIHDPLFSRTALSERTLNGVDDLYSVNAVAVILVTMHREYESLDMKRLHDCGVRFFIDGRNKVNRNRVETAGIAYRGIGAG